MAKAPLSQTLILTEDGSTITVTTALAVTIPPIVIDLPPAFAGQPNFTSDGTPQVGEQITGVDAPVARLGAAVLRRAWLLGATVLTQGATFTPDDDMTYTFRNQIMLAGVVVATTSVDVAVSAPTAVPPPAPSNGTPVIAQTSTASSSPFKWTTAKDDSFQPGFIWHVQRAAFNAFPSISNAIILNGDSWDVDSGGSAEGFRTSNPNLKITNIARSGRSIGQVGTTDENTLVAKEVGIIAAQPQMYSVGDGANDLGGYASGEAFADALKGHLQRLKDKLPGLLIVCRTILARQVPGNDAFNAKHHSARPAANTAMRQWLADGFIAGLIDLAADSVLGPDSAMIPAAAGTSTISTDGLHLHTNGPNSGSGRALAIGVPELNRVAALFPQLTGEAYQQITPQDLASGEMTFADLSTTPSGSLFLRERVGHDDGTGAILWGGWSNVLNDTIVLTTPTAFDSNPDNKNQYAALSNGNRTVTGLSGLGAPATARSKTAKTAGKFYLEFTWVAGSNPGEKYLGITNPNLYAKGYPGPAEYNPGFCWRSGYLLYIDGVGPTYFYESEGVFYDFDGTRTVGIAVDKDNGKFWLRRHTGEWGPYDRIGDPVEDADGDPVEGGVNGYPLTAEAQRFVAALVSNDSCTVNTGQTTFAMTPPTGFGIWSE